MYIHLFISVSLFKNIRKIYVINIGGQIDVRTGDYRYRFLYTYNNVLLLILICSGKGNTNSPYDIKLKNQ